LSFLTEVIYQLINSNPSAGFYILSKTEIHKLE